MQFLSSGQDLSVAYLNTYNMPLVLLSVLMAVFASFTALQLSQRIARAETGYDKIVWLVPGALALGGGVWAMHFVGMLAFSLPCNVSYDPFITLLSMIPGVLASAVALWVIGRVRVTHTMVAIGGSLMGAGIGLMHYSGMAAMQLDAVIYYSPVMFFASIIFAIAMAILSLYVKFIFADEFPGLSGRGLSLLGGIFMGSAISGMHYIAIEAAYFIPIEGSTASESGASPTLLAIGIGTATALLIALALAASFMGRHLETIKVLEREVDLRKQVTRSLEFQKHALDEHAIVSITDVKGNITYINNKFCDISGYSNEELLGQNHRLLKSNEHPPEFFKELWQTIASGNTWQGDVKNKRKDGSEYWVTATIVPFLGDDGKPFQYVGIRTEITERKEAERIAEEAREDAEVANEAKSHFLANMSHELRTPLNAILGFSEMIKLQSVDEGSNRKHVEYAEDIHASGTHLLSLVNDILHMSKIEAGTHQLQLESIDIVRLIDESLSLVQEQANDKNISLLKNIADDLPPMFADYRAFKQCLINLLSNAVKFTPERGEVTVSVNVSHQWFDFSVSDTGIGVAKEDLGRITQPFTQIERMQTSRVHEGTGIGLTITRNLVEMHGGILGIESEPNIGTTATIRLPRGRSGNGQDA